MNNKSEDWAEGDDLPEALRSIFQPETPMPKSIFITPQEKVVSATPKPSESPDKERWRHILDKSLNEIVKVDKCTADQLVECCKVPISPFVKQGEEGFWVDPTPVHIIELHDAVVKNNLTRIEKSIELYGAEVIREANRYGDTAMTLAVSFGKSHIVKLFKEKIKEEQSGKAYA